MTGSKKESDSPLEVDKKKLFIHFIVLIVLTALLFAKYWIIEKININPTSIDSSSTGDTSSILGSPKDDNLLKEVVTFSIKEENKFIELVPKQSNKIQFEELNPAGADLATLKFEPSIEGIITIKNGEITALDEIAEGETCDIYITITAQNYKDIIRVRVTNPKLPDDTEGLMGNGQNE